MKTAAPLPDASVGEDWDSPVAEFEEAVDEMLRLKNKEDKIILFESWASSPRLVAAFEDDTNRVRLAMAKLSKTHGFGERVRSLKKLLIKELEYKKLARRTQTVNDMEVKISTATKLSMFVDLPTNMPSGLCVPPGYSIDKGISRIRVTEEGDVKEDRITHDVIFPVERAVDVDTGEAILTLCWPMPSGKWMREPLARREAMDSRKIMALSARGAPINSTNASEVIKWLVDFEAENRDRLEESEVASRLGWHDNDGERSFLMPEGVYGKGDVSLARGTGYDHLLRGWVTHGTFEGWLEAVEPVKNYPLVMVAMYVSACAPLLNFLDSPNFIVDWSDDTSSGKTSSLRLAASVWGRPSEDAGGIIYSWDDTNVAIQLKCGFLHHLPVIVDESKRARHPGMIGKMIYAFCHGQDRGRGAKEGGLRSTSSWRTVMLSTGEAPLTSFGTDAGTKARVLCLRGKPLGDVVDVGRRLSDNLRFQLMEHHGHLGRHVVQYLIDTADQHDEYVAKYKELQSSYAEMFTSAVGGRAASYAAVLDMTRSIVHAIGVPMPDKNPMDLVIQSIQNASGDANIADQALFDMMSWCSANQHRFFGRADSQPNGGYVGQWSHERDWKTVNISIRYAKQFLADGNYYPNEIIQRWKDRDYLNCSSKSATKTCRVKGLPMRCLSIRREIIDALFQEK